MKKTRFTESQIISILKQQEQGHTVAQIAREYGITLFETFQTLCKTGSRLSNPDGVPYL